MRIGWRTITALQRFLCERQNVLVKKRTSRKDISFGIKRGRFNGLLREINEDICQNKPVSPDWLESILSIFIKDGLIKLKGDSKNRFIVSEEAYRLSGIKMVRPKKPPTIKKEKPKGKLEKFRVEKKLEEIKRQPPQPIMRIISGPKRIPRPEPMVRIMSEEERRARPKAITQFEKGISLYHKRRYQEAIIEFQKVIDDFNIVMDVIYKAKQYIRFCKDDLRKNKIEERRARNRFMLEKKEIEVEAKSPQEAIEIALEKLGTKRDQVEIKILSEERKGLFGMEGQKQAKVKVILK